jgi:DNA polymerase III subunit delta
MAAAEGDTARLERILGRVFQEGESPVSVIRAVLRHLHRLHALTALVSTGMPIGEALRGARPPIFYKHEDSFKRQLGLWSEARLRPELDRIALAEINMKTTGLPAETLCRQAMAALAQAARAG